MLWRFSESSQPLLKRCIEASKLDKNNLWLQKFGHLVQNESDTVKNEVINENGMNKDFPSLMSLDSQATVIVEEVDVQEEIWREITDMDLAANFNYIEENCLNNSKLYSLMALYLPVSSIEKLCDHIFGTINVKTTFVENFYKLFLPVFLKREYSRISLDIIVKADKHNSELFKCLMEIIIRDMELPNQVLQQFISMLDNNRQYELLKNIIILDLTNETFIYHLYSIHILYKNCQKTDEIQKYIMTRLTQVSQECINDKNYGRLLLTYIQAQRNFTTSYSIVQMLIDSHRSPFKKPCLNAFNELKKLHDPSIVSN